MDISPLLDLVDIQLITAIDPTTIVGHSSVINKIKDDYLRYCTEYLIEVNKECYRGLKLVINDNEIFFKIITEEKTWW